MNEFPVRKDFLSYVEGETDLEPALQEQILRMLGSDPNLRQEFAEIKRDLYLVDAQIPFYIETDEFKNEIAGLYKSWTALRNRRA